MPDQCNHVSDKHARRKKRSLILMILGRPERCSRAELEAELHDIDPLAVSDALAKLEAGGVTPERQ